MSDFHSQKYVDVDCSIWREYSDLSFTSCSFEGCAFSLSLDPNTRSTLSRTVLKNCQEVGCTVGPAIIEDCVIDGFETSNLFQCWGTVFKRVVLRGKIGRIMLSPAVAPGVATPVQQQSFNVANKLFYTGVDWALDVSEGDFQECELQGIPAHLIRRDPETQVVIKRYKILDGAWRDINLSGTHWATSIEFFLERGEDSVVLVAPKRNRRFKELLQGLQCLRKYRIAESD